MKLIKKIFLILLVLLIVAGIVAWAWLNDWPWWMALTGCALVLGVVLGIVFIRRYLARRRERLFVKRVIEEDNKTIESVPEYQRPDFQEMQDKWKEAVSLLSKSHLRKQGNPLYALPWFLFLGEAGSGKSTALKNSRLASPLTDIPRVTGIAGTRNFDWWFFEKAIILDTAGRYSIPIDEISDREEWENFLTLVAKYRKKEPLNGIVVTVSAENLLKDDNTKLTDNGQYLRKRIDQVMRVTGHKIPVYILVTKLDRIHGMTAFASAIDEKYFAQCLGYACNESETEWESFLQKAITSIVLRLRKIRFLLTQHAQEPDPGLLLFPQELERLYPGLKAFCEGLLAPNPYQESPFLRGIYLSSARQEGQVLSEFLDSLGLQKFATIRTTLREKGMFLRDLLATILPEDRFLFFPLREYQYWKRRTIAFAMFAWLFLHLGLAGLIAGAYHHNLKMIQNARQVKQIDLGADVGANLILLSNYGRTIEDLQGENEAYNLPQPGFNYGDQILAALERDYLRSFKEYVLDRLDMDITRTIKDMDASTDEQVVLKYIDFIVTQMNILKQWIDKEKVGQSVYDNLAYDIPVVFAPLTEEIAPYFVHCYRYYLLFSPQYDLQTRKQLVLSQLKNILLTKGTDFHWVVNHPELKKFDLTQGSFWGYALSDDNEQQIIVPGAFTVKGKQKIDEFMAFLQKALADENILTDEVKKSFAIWYGKMFFARWRKFIRDFPDGEMALQDWPSRHEMAITMCGEDNPYFNLLKSFAEQTAKVLPDGPRPDWAKPVLTLARAQKEALNMDQARKQQPGLKEKLKRKLLKGFSKVKAAASSFSDMKQAREYQEILRLARMWLEYEKHLKALEPITSDGDTAFEMTAAFFPYGTRPLESKSVFFLTSNDLYAFRQNLKKYGNPDLCYLLLSGPFEYLLDYAVMETACVLQARWEEEVIGKIQGLEHLEKIKLLFAGDQPLVDQFLQGTAKPFVGTDRFGYYPRKAIGQRLPFSRDFFAFVNQGKNLFFTSQKSFEISFKTMPVGANKDASLQPYGCKLSLQCADKCYELENFNFPASSLFKWSPETCGDVVLTIYLPGLKLEKKYSGPLALARFLLRFRDGTARFVPSDFPESAGFLQSKSIKWIKVAYEIKGAEPILKMLQEIPDEIPLDILTCWHN